MFVINKSIYWGVGQEEGWSKKNDLLKNKFRNSD